MSWIPFAIGLVLAALGSTAGSALVTVSRAELTRVVSSRLRGAESGLAGLAEVDRLLTAASAVTSLGVLLLGASLPALLTNANFIRSTLPVAILAVPLVLAGGYFIPRWLTSSRSNDVASWLVPVLRPVATGIGVLLPTRAARRPDEFRAIWREGAAVGFEADEEMLMAGGALAFAQRPVRDVMTPRTDVVAIGEDAPLADIRAVFAHSGYSRIPVYRGTIDEIIGMLHAFDLFKLREHDPLPVRPVGIAPASRSCGDLLLDMQRERRHLCIVLDEFGGTLGIVTLEDLLEELVGEIFDEHDEASEPNAPTSGDIFETDGAATTSVIEDRFGVALPSHEATTVAGFLLELAGRIPATGERFLVGGLEFDVLQASPTRVERVLVRPGPVPTIPLPARTS